MKITRFFLLISFFLTFVLSCKNDDEGSDVNGDQYKITIEALSTNNSITDFDGFTCTITNKNSLQETVKVMSSSGILEFNLSPGNYDIVVTKEGVGYGIKENVSINKDQKIEINIIKQKYVSGLVIKEVYFSGVDTTDEYGPYIDLQDQYVVIYNNSNEVKYLDGISYAITKHWNSFPYMDYVASALQQNMISADFVYTFPGNGTDYPILPGEEKVLARSAQNFSLNISEATDLTGADFEVFLSDSNDIDIPSVPNMILNGTIRTDFLGYGTGYASPFLFKQEGDLRTFLEAQSFMVEGIIPGQMQEVFNIPKELIIDAVETGYYLFDVKAFPDDIDAGKILNQGAGTREVYVRKTIVNSNLLQDTNNSSNDFEIRLGQRSFPKN